MIAASGKNGIQLVQVECREHLVQQSLGHRRVIDHAERRPPAAALHALRYLLQDTVAQVVVDFHLGIAGKLERERLEVRIILSGENQRQAAADDIIQIHQETLPVFVRQADEAAADADRQLEESIFRHFPFAVFSYTSGRRGKYSRRFRCLVV